MDFSKTKVASAAVNHSKIDVSSTHITTSSFMQLQPVYYRHMLPGEHIKGSGNVLSRLAPVAVPTYGRCRINMRSFFVPFRTVFPNFNEFITDTLAFNNANSSLVQASPIITSKTILTFFLTYPDQIFSQPLSRFLDPSDPDDVAAIADGAYDFTYSGAHYVLSYYGRLYWKILESLGYRVLMDDKDAVEFSALPLLAYAKVYVDWYANSAYLNNQYVVALNKLFKYNDPASQLALIADDLSDIMCVVGQVYYDSGNDVYLQAWDHPYTPNYNLSSAQQVSDLITGANINSVAPTSGVNGASTPYMRQSSATQTSLGTEFLHESLKAMTDYMKRNQLSGAYAVDRFLARYGINLDSANVNRSIYIGASSVDIDFGSVMQTANTAGSGNVSNLGDYAGQGFGKGSLSFDFKTDEFGLFVVMASILPQGHFYQGFDRNLLHINMTDFYTPEYDNLGCAAISKGEVYVSRDSAFAASGNNYLDLYGYAPRFYEYKQKSDFVTGDFVMPAAMIGGDAWHLQRKLEDANFVGGIVGLEHSQSITAGYDSGQYDRIFNYTKSDLDKFYLVYHFSAESLAPCKSLFDSYDFEELGKQLTMDAGGSKVN